MQVAAELGAFLARQGIRLVYGGGNIGMMGCIADAALREKGEVIGVIPRFMMSKEVAHAGVTEMRVVETMHARKALMEELSDASITLPGGIGTFEEFCEMLAWAQLGLHPKACGLLNVAGYYDSMISMLDRATEDGFIHKEHRRLLTVAADSAELLARMEAYKYPYIEKWLERGRE